MKYGSLFSGIGGFDFGLERAGMECVWQVENNPYAIKVLEKHWPEVRRYEDVRKVGKHNLEPVDLIAGGFPCQPHSVAGKRRGAEDDRNLWPEYLRIVREVRPQYVLAENVPGIITTYIDTVLSDLEGEGYTCWTFNIPACAFDAPHRRQRIFVVAYADKLNDDSRGLRTGEVCGERSVQTEIQRSEQNATDSTITDDGQSSPEPMWRQAQQSGVGIIEADVQNSKSKGLERNECGILEKEETGISNPDLTGSSWWTVEPDVGRVVDGVPKRVDRLKCLGNAVVPQVAEWIGRKIMEVQ